MAVAFTRDEDYESQAADLPDRPVSTHPNLVTASGLSAIEAQLAAARAAYAQAQSEGGISADRTAMARATRDLRYWSSRRASAQLTQPYGDEERVLFGRTVAFEREDGRRQKRGIPSKVRGNQWSERSSCGTSYLTAHIHSS